jgi:hypothetical protein
VPVAPVQRSVVPIGSSQSCAAHLAPRLSRLPAPLIPCLPQGLAVRDYWAVDDNTIVFVADPTFANIVNVNVGAGVDLEVPQVRQIGQPGCSLPPLVSFFNCHPSLEASSEQ